jgi:hypothetical protein
VGRAQDGSGPSADCGAAAAGASSRPRCAQGGAPGAPHAARTRRLAFTAGSAHLRCHPGISARGQSAGVSCRSVFRAGRPHPHAHRGPGCASALARHDRALRARSAGHQSHARPSRRRLGRPLPRTAAAHAEGDPPRARLRAHELPQAPTARPAPLRSLFIGTLVRRLPAGAPAPTRSTPGLAPAHVARLHRMETSRPDSTAGVASDREAAERFRPHGSAIDASSTTNDSSATNASSKSRTPLPPPVTRFREAKT